MARVAFTSNLARFFPALAERDVDAASVKDLLATLERDHAGLSSYLVDERGSLRPHVNVFIDGRPVRDRDELSDTLGARSQVFVAQALSGG